MWFYANYKGVSALDLLNTLKKLPITLEVLQKTRYLAIRLSSASSNYHLLLIQDWYDR